MGEKYTVRQDGSGAWQVWNGLDTCLRPQALACDAEALADALNSAHAAGLATAQAELDTLRNEIASLTRLDWTGTLCDRLNMIARRHGWNPCRNGEEGAALAVVVDSYCASSQAELAALRAKWEALAGVLRWVSENTSDENTSQYIRAMTITLTDSTHALENP